MRLRSDGVQASARPTSTIRLSIDRNRCIFNVSPSFWSPDRDRVIKQGRIAPLRAFPKGLGPECTAPSPGPRSLFARISLACAGFCFF